MLDVQPGLTTVLAETTGAITTRYIHGPTGIHAQQNPGGDWRWLLQDGLGSVRAVANTTDVIAAQQYSPYGVPASAMTETDFGFTGEMTDDNDLVYLRARYLHPGMGVFASRDPFAGTNKIPSSLNRYAWVSGNVVNLTDSAGLTPMLWSTKMGGGGGCGGQSISQADPVNELAQLCNTYKGGDKDSVILNTADRLGALRMGIDKLEQAGASLPPWIKAIKFAEGFAAGISQIDAAIKFICALNAGDNWRTVIEGTKAIPGVGDVVAFIDEVALDKSKATLPPQPNPEFTHCATGSSFSAQFPTPESRLAQRYVEGCSSTLPEFDNRGICVYPSDLEVRAGLETIDALQASGVIPYDLSSVSVDDVKRYSFVISASSPYVSATSNNKNLWLGVQSRDPGKLGGSQTVAAYLLMARTYENHHDINPSAFGSAMTEAGHTGASLDRDFLNMTTFLENVTWRNTAVCSP